MNQSPLDASVVICAYTEDRWEDLVAAVESVRRQSAQAREIVVVVDHNPRLLERARAQLADVVVVENSEPRGASGSKNSGALAARGAIVVFLDDDAEATPDWLGQLLAAYANPDVVGVGGAIEPRWPGARPGWFPDEFNWVVGCTYRGLPKRRAPVRNLIGANMSFRREVFDKVRLYHEIGHIGTRPFGGSDPDFCIRVSRRWPEKILLYEPCARVYHRVSATRARFGYFRLRCYNEGLSKSMLTRRVGAQDGLSSERSYIVRTLPLGVARGLVDLLAHGDRWGLARGAAIVAGLAITLSGYCIGSLAQWAGPKQLPESEAAR
jgi:glycosyltransferase involved in cell wall biosynthesis